MLGRGGGLVSKIEAVTVELILDRNDLDGPYSNTRDYVQDLIKKDQNGEMPLRSCNLQLQRAFKAEIRKSSTPLRSN
ncbi:hypothetical protein TMES_02980 [Thalassospira mesophila]|uniref:Uncharacterized protein n=1 Tax=Thalassospira mesophila TaxID=1293891 RepID=A0A1Y2L4F2_9PROT|nr:hypothetical protein TMES_02980 [Thalassospira mesophila]